MGRHRKNTPEDGWKKKLHKVFFELAGLNREFERRWLQMQDTWRREQRSLDPTAMDKNKEFAAKILRERNQLEQWLDEQYVNIDNRHKPISYNPIAYSFLTLDRQVSDSDGIKEYIHFQRHGESLRVTEAKDAQGDLSAWDKLSRTGKDLRILAFAKGPIAPFQGDMVHRQLLQLVISYEKERLTAEELVQCFDECCVCGKENHGADALRKMRDRFEGELRGSMKSP